MANEIEKKSQKVRKLIGKRLVRAKQKVAQQLKRVLNKK